MAQRHFACTCKSRTSEMLEVTEKVNRHNFLFSPWNVGLHVFSQFGGEIGNTLCCVDTLKCISKRHHPFSCASILPFPGQQQELLAPTALAGTMGKPYLASQGVPLCQTLWWSLGFLSVSWLTPWPHTAHLIPQPPVTWHVWYWEARCKNGDREHLCPRKQHKHILKPLPALARYCCSDSSVSLLLAGFIRASAPPMSNTWSLSAPAFAKGFHKL